MFTGIVREKGRVAAAERRGDALRLVVEAGVAAAEEIGASVALDGCCLTVVEREGALVQFDLSLETLSRTTLGRLQPGDELNVEPALRAGEPLGGHYVQGHVDGVGTVRSFDGETLWVDAPAQILRYCVEKGSLTVSGVSLTIAALDEQGVAFALIPHTLEVTTLGTLEPGDHVNLEVDVLAKYVERLLVPRDA
ncbi:MAG: riboflavin synthase [Gaiellaceae bacterium]|nr:riboflavin synthase [Gaiellaceae bacterium]